MKINSNPTAKATGFTPDELAAVTSFVENWGRAKFMHDDGVNRTKAQDLIKKPEDEDGDDDAD